MNLKESENVEFKIQVIDEIKKCVIAFANSGGGILYIGVDDDGEIVGIAEAETALMNVNNMLRDGIKPDVTLFVKSQIERKNDKKIIKVDIQSGTERPYYLVGKGIRPDGVFIRHGAASVPATDTAIRKMIRETDGDSYEKVRSLEQKLTFEAAKAEFDKRKVQFGSLQMATLGMINSEKIYSNLALLLSEQCYHSIKVAIFQDETQQVFKDRQEFEGSLFKQINDVYSYLSLNNNIRSTFEKLLRIDQRDYPEAALREALLNAIVHREYATSSSILIKIFSNRIEFISPGGLINGIELADIMSGYSISRNPNLAKIFYRLQFVEAYGTGILKIFEAYKLSAVQPKIEVTPNVFKLILPNLNAIFSVETGKTSEGKILEYIQNNGSINRKKTEEILGISQTATGLILRNLTEQGLIERKGNSRNINYYLRK